MGRITAGVGLISGLDIDDIITKLISIEKRPLDLLTRQADLRKTVQAALSGLSAKLLTLQFSASDLSKSEILDSRAATSSNEGLLKATAQPSAALGTYLLRPVRQAQTQQYIAAGFKDIDTTPIGAGTIIIKQGGGVQPAASLSQLNGGQGVRLGLIRITDRSGASTVVDLSTAQTVDDVLNAINQNHAISVTASAAGDSLALADETGLTLANLAVQEVNGGSAAADLGLLGSVAGGVLAGDDLVRLSPDLRLDYLNDGNGLRQAAELADFRIDLRDGSTFDVDLDGVASVQDVLSAVNNHAGNGGKLTAAIAPDGKRLLLTDNTAGGGTLTITSLNSSQVAIDLGLLEPEQGGVVTGARIVGGLRTVLLRNLQGGSGVPGGQIQLTDRSGATASVDLTSSETLDDVISGINGAGLGLVASVNATGHGIVVNDTTGATASNLIVADLSGGTLAADLNIAADVAGGTVSSGDVNLRYIGENSRLDRLNGGTGIERGRFKITAASGQLAEIDLTSQAVQTVGDVLVKINASGLPIQARINDTGDGILLTDLSGAVGDIQVAELGRKTAAGLNLLGSGAGHIDGGYRFEIEVESDDTLDSILPKFINSGAGVTAAILNDGGPVAPYRLLLTSQRPGQAGRFLIDAGSTGLDFSTLAEGTDALLGLASGVPGGQQLLFTSSNNTFQNVAPGLSVELKGTSTSPVTVTVSGDSTGIETTIDSFVKSFNGLRDSLVDLTAFNPDTNERGVLQGDRTAQQIETALFDLVGQSFGASQDSLRNFSQIGLTLKDGNLVFDAKKLRDRLAADPAAVKGFFSDPTSGVSKRLEQVLKRLTDRIDGSITRRVNSLADQNGDAQKRVDFLTERLEARRQRLVAQFLAMEQTLALIQTQQEQISRIAALPTLIDQKSSNN